MAHNDLTLLGADLASAVQAAPANGVRWGEITAITGATCSVKLGGADTAIDGVPRLASYTPTVGDAVTLLPSGTGLFILGTLAS